MKYQLRIKSIVSFAVLFVGLTVSTFAQTITHTVESGETLYKIAQQYNVDVQDLREWNNFQSEELSIGQEIRVKNPGAEEGKTHIVEPKETLFSISKKYDVTIAELKTWNNLSTNNLSEGQKLIIYPSDSPESTNQSIVAENDSQQNDYYTVKSGDSLYKIAERHEMSVDELQELNDLSTSTIRVGQQLTVRADNSAPPSVSETVESSAQGKFISYEIPDGSPTLDKILSEFNMDEREFRALNPDVNPANLRAGQHVTILAPPNRSFDNPYLAQPEMQDLGSVSVSKYSRSARGSTTTNGELYNPDALTAAHSNISLGSIIFIENKNNQTGIYVRINDRSSGNGLKLSTMAWNALNFRGSNPAVTIFQE